MGDYNFEREILDRLIKIETKIDDYVEVKKQVSDVNLKLVQLVDTQGEHGKDIQELKDRNKWLSRAIVGAVITAFISIITVLVKIGIGVG